MNILDQIKAARRGHSQQMQRTAQLKARLRDEIRQEIILAIQDPQIRDNGRIPLVYRTISELLQDDATTDATATMALLAQLQLDEFCQELYTELADQATENCIDKNPEDQE